MTTTNRIAETRQLLGEPARTAMLLALMDGRARTAGELARCAGVTPQTASGHLSRLCGAGLLDVVRQGRHRYHRLAGAEVAELLESVVEVAATAPARAGPGSRVQVFGPRDAAMRRARTCYDHFAGRLGVTITQALQQRGVIEFDHEAGLLTAAGARVLGDLGIALSPAGRRSARPICRPCLDWSERRPHVAGQVGAAICRHFMQAAYVRRIDGGRTLAITGAGRRALRQMFGIERL
jgi:DNA-binding transcriptional ArsR family regulator